VPKSSPPYTLGLLVAVLLSACGPAEQTTPTASATVPAVTVARVAKQDVTPSMSFTGRVEAVEKVDLIARVNGFLEQRLFEEGKQVKKGDLLFVIEKAPYEAQIAQVKGAIASVKGALELADVEVARFTELVQKKAVSQNDLDQRIAKQTQARGELLSQEANLQKAELDLSYTDIRAPISGRIGRANITVGNYVTPSSGALATIVSEDPTYVTFPVSVRELLAIRRQAQEEGADPKATTVKLRLSDNRLLGESGNINFADVQVNSSTDTIAIRAQFPNPNNLLVDGAIVTAIVEVAKPEQSLVIPQQAIQADQAGRYVLVVDAENKVQVRRLTASGPPIDGMVPVKEGLAEGDRVITDGVQKVRPGIVVAPVEAAPKAAGDAK
jgi:membrane fusion protein, multidrug efflux system